MGLIPYQNWDDGFTEAIKVLSKNYNFDWVNVKKAKPRIQDYNQYDAYFAKGKYKGLAMNFLLKKIPKTVPRLYFITSSTPIPQSDSILHQFDVLFYETEWFKEKYLQPFSQTIRAFGVNTRVFNQLDSPQIKDIDYFLSSNLLYCGKARRVEKFCKLPGKKLAVLTGVHKHPEVVKLFREKKIPIYDRMPRVALKKLYQRSKCVYIPHEVTAGGDRTVLDARACGAKVLIEKDNKKLRELVNGPILNEIDYAREIYKGLEAIGLGAYVE